MATTNNLTTFVVNAAGFCKTAVQAIVLILACGFTITVMSPVVFIVYGLLFNPLCFLAWSFIAPKAAIKFVLEQNARREEKLTWLLLWGVCIWTWLADKILHNISMHAWYVRREYISQTSLAEAPFLDQLRYFNESDQAKLIEKKQLGTETFNHVWPSLGESLRALAIKVGYKLSASQFFTLVYHKEWKNVIAYANKYTLSEKMLLDLYQGANLESEGFTCLRRIIWSNGLSTNLISAFYNRSDEMKQKAINEALLVYAQREAVKALDEASLIKFFKQQTSIHCAAQILMTKTWQYQAFVNQGFKMEMCAVEYFLAQEKCSFIEQLLKNEVAGKEISPKAEALIRANSKLTNLMTSSKENAN